MSSHILSAYTVLGMRNYPSMYESVLHKPDPAYGDWFMGAPTKRVENWDKSSIHH